MYNQSFRDVKKPTIISGENYGVKTTVEIDHSDISLDEVFDAFETIVVGMGFHKDGWKQWILDRADEYREDEGPDYDSAGFNFEDRYPHYVTNEEADEDAGFSVRSKFNGITQKLLDYVDRRGAISYTELHTYYKIHSGSNSFSHILANLRIPYKNRKTQRYLVKEGKRYSDAKYVVKVANPSNWVVVDY
jgi:hypothetical protein